MTIVENLPRIQVSIGKKSLEDGNFGWTQDAGHPERSETAGDRARSQGRNTSSFEQPASTSMRFSDTNPFRKFIHNPSPDLHIVHSHDAEPQQSIRRYAPSRVSHHPPPNVYNLPLVRQLSTFLPPSGFTHPTVEPPQRSPPSQSLPLGGRSHAESLSVATRSNTDFRTREQVEALTPWSTPLSGHPRGLGGLNYPWLHSGSPASFQPQQPTFSPGRGPIIIGNQNTIHFTCHTHDSGNMTTTRLTDSANNSSSRISGNTNTGISPSL